MLIADWIEFIKCAIKKDIINGKCCVKITLIELFPLNIDVNVNCRSLKDKISDLNFKTIYQGWMISSSPSVTPFEHPTYDIWVNDCLINKDQ